MVCLPSRINCSQACGPFVNYTVSWEVLPRTVSMLPNKALRDLLFALASEAVAVSLFVITWWVRLFPFTAPPPTSPEPMIRAVNKLFGYYWLGMWLRRQSGLAGNQKVASSIPGSS